MALFTAAATALLGAVGLSSTFLVGAYTEPSIKFDPRHKRVQA